MKKTKYEEFVSKVDPELLKKWKEEQDNLKSLIIEKDDFSFSINNKDGILVEDGSALHRLKRIGGMDISASKTDPNVAIVALVVCDADSFEVLYEKYEFVTMTQPYVPGFLAFREVEHLLKLVKELGNTYPELLPQIILIDGNGIFHCNRFGLACHLGVISGFPYIVFGKSVFLVDGITKRGVKTAAKTLQNGGDFLYLQGHSGAVWGAALKATKKSTDPLIISIGHKITLDSALNVVKRCTKFRVPEPTRIADKRSRALIKQYESTKKIYDIDDYLSKLKQDINADSGDEDTSK